ncbi:hypothetical protein IJH97_00460 [Candidatus Saccharibacteria bacterium]|nr:hypothetical protein [Candidatus Saccharibacteria bacterium]
MDSKNPSAPQSGEPKTTPPVYFDSKNISSSRPTSGSASTITPKNERKIPKPKVSFGTKLANFFKSLGSNLARFFRFIGRNIAAFFKFAFTGKRKFIAIPVTVIIVAIPVTLIILFNTVWKSSGDTPNINPADNGANYQLTGWHAENQQTLDEVYAKINEGQTDSLEKAVQLLDEAIAATADNQPKQYDLIIDKVVLYNTAAEDPETALNILKSIKINGLDEDQKFILASNFIVVYEAMGDESSAQKYRDLLYAVGGLTEDSAWYNILKEQGELPPDMNAELADEEEEATEDLENLEEDNE